MVRQKTGPYTSLEALLTLIVAKQYRVAVKDVFYGLSENQRKGTVRFIIDNMTTNVHQNQTLDIKGILNVNSFTPSGRAKQDDLKVVAWYDRENSLLEYKTAKRTVSKNNYFRKPTQKEIREKNMPKEEQSL